MAFDGRRTGGEPSSANAFRPRDKLTRTFAAGCFRPTTGQGARCSPYTTDSGKTAIKMKRPGFRIPAVNPDIAPGRGLPGEHEGPTAQAALATGAMLRRGRRRSLLRTQPAFSYSLLSSPTRRGLVVGRRMPTRRGFVGPSLADAPSHMECGDSPCPPWLGSMEHICSSQSLTSQNCIERKWAPALFPTPRRPCRGSRQRRSCRLPPSETRARSPTHLPSAISHLLHLLFIIPGEIRSPCTVGVG